MVAITLRAIMGTFCTGVTTAGTVVAVSPYPTELKAETRKYQGVAAARFSLMMVW